MTKDVIELAREAGLSYKGGDYSGLEFCALNGHEDLTPALIKFAALVAARERERLFGKERDGDMRLMMHRWQGGKCWAEAIHFPAEQTRFGPSGVLDRAVVRMSMDIDAAIRAINTQGEGNGRP